MDLNLGSIELIPKLSFQKGTLCSKLNFNAEIHVLSENYLVIGPSSVYFIYIVNFTCMSLW